MYEHHYLGLWISMTQHMTSKINVGHCDLYFMVQWFCVISWRLFDVCTSYFRSMNQYDPKFDLKINVGHCDLYFMVQRLCLIAWRLFHVPIFHGPVILCFILRTIWCVNIILGDYGSVWPEVWPQNKCMSLWPIFHGPLILPYISKTIWWMSVIFSDNEKVWHKPWPKNKYRSTWPIFLGLMILLNILEDYLIDEHHNWYNGSVWHKDWPHQVYVGQWPIFSGPVILLHILKAIWWRNVVLGIINQCDTKIDLLKYMSVAYISWSIEFAFYHCHRLKSFVYIKKWRWPGVFVPLQALALVRSFLSESSSKLPVTRTGIKARTSLISGRIRLLTYGVTCPWMTKILHFRTWISLRPLDQFWSNFMCSITGGDGKAA